jgi:hypothetical protein
MKLAWLCYTTDEDSYPTIQFEEPSRYSWFKVVPIVYAEIVA